MIVSIIEPGTKRLLARLMFTNPSRSARHFMLRIYKSLRGPNGPGLLSQWEPGERSSYEGKRRTARRVARMLFNQQAFLDIACYDAEYEVIKSLPRQPG